MSWLFASGGQSIGVSASASAFLMNIEGIFTSPGRPTMCQTQRIESLWLHALKLTFCQRKERERAHGQMRKAAASAVERRRQAQGRRVVTAGLWGLRGIREGRPPAGGGAGSGTAALPNR